MKNFIQSGINVELPIYEGVKSGDGVLVGNLFGVATGDATPEHKLVVSTSGVFALKKKAGEAIALGEFVFWRDAEKEASFEGFAKIGIALEASGVEDNTVVTKLIGFAADPATLMRSQS